MSKRISVELNNNGVVKLGLNLNETNAFDLAAFHELSQALRDLAQRDDIRVLVLHSEQNEVFSQGLSLKEMAQANEDTIREFIRLFFSNLHDLYLFPHPVICAMRGHAMGYGCMLALVSDYRFITEKARIGLPEVKLGIRVPTLIARILQNLVGTVEADHHILEGGAYKGSEAKDVGLIDELVESDVMLAFAEKHAQKFLKNSRSAVSASKKAMRQQMDLTEIIKADTEETLKTLQTPDAREGISAAVEMRRPKFS